MGYTLSIGEAVVKGYLEERYACIDVERVDGRELGAPIDSTGNKDSYKNETWPAYTQWAGFAVRHDLGAVFFAGSPGFAERVWLRPDGEEGHGLIASHPGAEALTQNHLIEFRRAAARHFAPEPQLRLFPSDVDWDGVRLRWLCWWTAWALSNCKYPTFKNS